MGKWQTRQDGLALAKEIEKWFSPPAIQILLLIATSSSKSVVVAWDGTGSGKARCRKRWMELVPRGANQPSQGELSNEEQVVDLDGRCVLRTQHGSRRRARPRCRSGFENRIRFRSRRRRQHESKCAWRPYRRHEPGVHGPRFGRERSDVAEQQVESRRPITGTVPLHGSIAQGPEQSGERPGQPEQGQEQPGAVAVQGPRQPGPVTAEYTTQPELAGAAG